MFGSSRPSAKSADPMPVPIVRTMIVPRWRRPAPKRSSARPATSASLPMAIVRPMTRDISRSAGNPIHAESMFAAVRTVPPRVAEGMPMPTGRVAASAIVSDAPSPAVSGSSNLRTSVSITATTSRGTDGCGVGMRMRSPTNWPERTSTTAPLIPLPPKSIPIARLGPIAGSADLASIAIDPPRVDRWCRPQGRLPALCRH